MCTLCVQHAACHRVPNCSLGSGFKISAKFRPNFAKFGNFGGGRKKNPKFCNTLIHVLYNFRLNFLLFILHIFVFNRCVVINHTNICLDLNIFFRKSIIHVLVSKKNSPKFRPNFVKFGSFGGGRNFCNTEIENPGHVEDSRCRCSWLWKAVR